MEPKGLLRAYLLDASGRRRPLRNCTSIVVEVAPSLELEIQLTKDAKFPEQVIIGTPPSFREDAHEKAGILDMLSLRPISANGLRVGIDRRAARR